MYSTPGCDCCDCRECLEGLKSVLLIYRLLGLCGGGGGRRPGGGQDEYEDYSLLDGIPPLLPLFRLELKTSTGFCLLRLLSGSLLQLKNSSWLLMLCAM